MEKKKRKNGFTFIELLVVTAVMAIITTLVLTEYRSGEKTNSLRLAVQQVVSDVRETQSSALSSGQFCDKNDPAGCGLGISFSVIPPLRQSYIIFVDKNADRWRASDGSENLKTVYLPNGIEIYYTTHPTQSNAIFVPPRPTTYSSPGLAWTEIGLKVIGTNLTQMITIGPEGAIDY